MGSAISKKNASINCGTMFQNDAPQSRSVKTLNIPSTAVHDTIKTVLWTLSSKADISGGVGVH